MTSLRDALPIASSKTATGATGRGTLRQARASGRGGDTELRPKLILASGSPRRLALLSQACVDPDALRPADIDETPKRREAPRTLAGRLAREKALAARDQIADDETLAHAHILAADTVVAVGRRVLLKPQHVEQAVVCLELLSGRSHRVYTGVCVLTPDDRVRSRVVETRVRFKRLSRSEIEAYVASREWRGKAGGYAIQGIGGCFVDRLVGSYTNVVGLPLMETVGLLQGEGFPVQYNWVEGADPAAAA
jgi:septum formation protein